MSSRFVIRNIELQERPVAFTHPFRFGAVTVHGAPEAVIHVGIELEDGRRATGASTELMVPKWFNKDAALSPDETVAQLRRALDNARKLYLAHGADTAFGLHAANHERQISGCAGMGLPALAANYGPAEIDKAVVDALLRALGLTLVDGLKNNVIGLDARLTPDIDDAAIGDFLASREPLSRVLIRHTVGMVDSLDELAEIHAQTGCSYFKIKLSGDPAADCVRLRLIAEKLSPLGPDYRVTLDANEQYPSYDALSALVDTLLNDMALAPIVQRLLYIEQPLPRDMTWTMPLGELGKQFSFIIDEADASYDAFPRARKLGYRGISSKACKGIYKSLLNGARSAHWNKTEGGRTFICAEDLTCQAGLAVQQDTALIAFHGMGHAERNGHHYGNGFAHAPAAEAQDFLSAHPDLYTRMPDGVRLDIRDGTLSIGSLFATAGFASGVDPARVGSGAAPIHVERIKEYEK